MVLAARAGGLEPEGGVEVPTPSNSQLSSKSQGIEGLSITGWEIQGPTHPTPTLGRICASTTPRFVRSCVLASVQAEFNAVPPLQRLRNQQPWPVSPRELDEMLDGFDPAAAVKRFNTT